MYELGCITHPSFEVRESLSIEHEQSLAPLLIDLAFLIELTFLYRLKGHDDSSRPVPNGHNLLSHKLSTLSSPPTLKEALDITDCLPSTSLVEQEPTNHEHTKYKATRWAEACDDVTRNYTTSALRLPGNIYKS